MGWQMNTERSCLPLFEMDGYKKKKRIATKCNVDARTIHEALGIQNSFIDHLWTLHKLLRI